MRRSSMKLSAVMAHSADPNEIITIVSTGAGSSPGYHTGRISARLCATAKCGKFTTDIREPSHFDLLLLNYGKYLSKFISFLFFCLCKRESSYDGIPPTDWTSGRRN